MRYCEKMNNHYSKSSLLLLVLIVLSLSIGGFAEESVSNDNTIIRIAIFRMSPEEGNFTANHDTIEKAVNISSERGANWFITPEMAESGYEFTDFMTIDQLPEFPSPWFSRLENLSREKNITLFIGFPERHGNDYHNSVAVIDREGNISGIHQKIDIIPGKNEGWATPGNATLLEVDNLTVGYYICADAVNQNITTMYLANNVDILLSSAAWYPDPQMGPDPYWKNVTTQLDVPLVIANTAGKKGKIDFTQTKSGVFQNGREIYLIPGSNQVIACVDWNYRTGEIYPVAEDKVE